MPDPSSGLTARLLLPLLCFASLAACAAARPPGGDAAPAVEKGGEKPMVTAASDVTSRLMVAEVALERGDCRTAADQYAAIAAASTEARVATRATQVGIACANLDAARRSAGRWRQLEPNSPDAALAAGVIALQLYRLDDARSALGAWRDAGSAGTQDPGTFAELLARESDATAAYRVFSDTLAGSDPTAEVLLAQAQLAQQAFDLNAAVKFAERALEQESKLTGARTLLIRSKAMLGDVDGALAMAREVQAELQGEEAFIVADILNAADRDDAARAELRRLREKPEFASAVDRRLGAMLLADGDLAAAEQQFTTLMGDRGTTAVALFYLAQIAERRGDDDRALQSYELLADSSLGLTARGAAARLLLKKGDSAKAMKLLEDYASAHPDEVVEVVAARGNLLAGQGLFDAALADLDAALDRFPGHPTLEYQRATVLERSGRKRDAVNAFKTLARKRPDDPGIANALGFTLADHKSELARAEKLVHQALAVSPDKTAIQDSQAWVLFRRGKTREAATILERAYRNLRDPEIGAHYGEVLWTLGDQGRAHYIWQQALNVDPANALLRGTISRLTGEEPPSGRR
ncbi:MAG: tetratricopeptide repeat protein [Steroidobacteraceae bacterium]